MSLETRSSSALFKRAEQLKRWEESETNREKIVPRRRNKKIQFSSGVVFLAACAAGDKDEVLRLLREGADIDTANVDGLTALHQLCIDDNLDMVEFLVENGADVNRRDNEGWTPLHATASCGFVSIAKYLIEHGGNVAAVNNDAELPVDLAETDEMEELLREILLEQGIDCDEARNVEQQMMLAHAKEWLNGGVSKDQPHPKTGATSLHVAAAKGYIKVISLLLQAGADINVRDFDGWTPLHAAAHWCQKEACEILVENFCDMDIRNCVGQTALDVADPDMVPVLEELRKKQATMQRDRNDTNAILQRKGTHPQKRRSSITRMSGADKTNLINKDASSERQLLAEQGSNKVKTVEVEIENSPEERDELLDMSSKIGTLAVNDIEKRNRVNRDEVSRIPLGSDLAKSVPTTPSSPLTTPSENEDSALRRPGSFRNRSREEVSNKSIRLEKDTSIQKATSPTGTGNRNSDNSDVVIRRTQSFEDEKRGEDSRSDTNATAPVSAASNSPTTTSPLPTNQVRSPSKGSVATAPTTPTSPGGSKLSPGNIFKNFFKSFVPPVRDEESETQRKAHAKRVRETRRSTQGVTLEELKTAEQIVKKKNQQLQQANQQVNSNNDQFLLEDARRSSSSVTETPSSTTYARRPPPLHMPVRPSSAPVEPTSPPADASVTIALRRQSKPPDDKEQDKENDIRNAQATQAVIQRRRRPKRRSTGVVHLDMDELNNSEVEGSPDVLGGGDNNEVASLRDAESGGDWSGNSRVSNSPGAESRPTTPAHSVTSSRSSKETSSENGEIDYKKLYEASIVENERLRDKLKKTEEDLSDARSHFDKAPAGSMKSSLSEIEKRERRAMERKLSEMEEELKQLQKLKAENEKLKAENRALTRVVSKITNSANATK